MKRKPTPLEARILQRLWDLGDSGTVHEVLEGWPEKPAPGYTTVLKVLQIMEPKGLVAHERRGRSYVYRALLARDEHSGGRLQELLHGLFEGDRLRFVNALVEEMELTEDEIREVRRMLSARSREKKP
jgi:BlaI family penicillinase repressor